MSDDTPAENDTDDADTGEHTGSPESNGRVLTAADLDLSRYDTVTELDDGRVVVDVPENGLDGLDPRMSGHPPVSEPTEVVERATDENSSSETTEATADAADRARPAQSSALVDYDLELVRYQADAETPMVYPIQSDSVITAFDDLLLAFTDAVFPATDREEALRLLIDASQHLPSAEREQ
jgi:fibronectin type 3 domain-containing protein